LSIYSNIVKIVVFIFSVETTLVMIWFAGWLHGVHSILKIFSRSFSRFSRSSFIFFQGRGSRLSMFSVDTRKNADDTRTTSRRHVTREFFMKFFSRSLNFFQGRFQGFQGLEFRCSFLWSFSRFSRSSGRHVV